MTTVGIWIWFSNWFTGGKLHSKVLSVAWALRPRHPHQAENTFLERPCSVATGHRTVSLLSNTYFERHLKRENR